MMSQFILVDRRQKMPHHEGSTRFIGVGTSVPEVNLAKPLSLSPEEIVDRVNEVMVRIFELEPGSLRREASLADDLDLDSLDGVDLVIALEKTFGCKLSEEEARSIRTLGTSTIRSRSGLRSARRGPLTHDTK